MSLLAAPIIKNSHIYAGTYSIFLKIVLNQSSKYFNTNFRNQWKDRKRSYQLKQILVLFVA